MFGLNLPRICKAHWPNIALATLASLCAGLVVANQLPKSYEGVARVRADYLSPDPVTQRYLPRSIVSRYAETQTAILADPIVTEPVAKRLGYVIAPPGGDTSNPEYLRSLRGSARTVARQTLVRWSDEVPEFNIQFYAGTPEAARKGAEVVREVYIDRMLEMKHRSDRETLNTLRDEAARVTRALDDATRRKREFEKKHNVHLFDDNRDSLENGLRALTGSNAVRERESSNTTRQRFNYGLLARTDAALAMATQQLGPNHPHVIALQAQRAALVAQAQSIAASGKNGAAPVAPAAQISSATARLLDQRDALDAARRIASEVTVLSQRAVSITAQAAEVQQRLASNYSGLEAIDSVKLPRSPISPRMTIIAVLSIAIGFVFGVQISVIIELLNRRVRGTDDLADLDVPVLVAYNRKRVLKVEEPEAEAA